MDARTARPGRATPIRSTIIAKSHAVVSATRLRPGPAADLLCKARFRTVARPRRTVQCESRQKPPRWVVVAMPTAPKLRPDHHDDESRSVRFSSTALWRRISVDSATNMASQAHSVGQSTRIARPRRHSFSSLSWFIPTQGAGRRSFVAPREFRSRSGIDCLEKRDLRGQLSKTRGPHVQTPKGPGEYGGCPHFFRLRLRVWRRFSSSCSGSAYSSPCSPSPCVRWSKLTLGRVHVQRSGSSESLSSLFVIA